MACMAADRPTADACGSALINALPRPGACCYLCRERFGIAERERLCVVTRDLRLSRGGSALLCVLRTQRARCMTRHEARLARTVV